MGEVARCFGKFIARLIPFLILPKGRRGAYIRIGRIAAPSLRLWLKAYFASRNRRGGPDDPFAYVGAPVKPRPPRRKSSVRLPLP